MTRPLEEIVAEAARITHESCTERDEFERIIRRAIREAVEGFVDYPCDSSNPYGCSPNAKQDDLCWPCMLRARAAELGVGS